MIHHATHPNGSIEFEYDDAPGNMAVKVTRASVLTNKRSSRTIRATWPQILLWIGGLEVQRALTLATADDREFLISGIQPEEWAKTFGSTPE
jgi:hypothetical protein